MRLSNMIKITFTYMIRQACCRASLQSLHQESNWPFLLIPGGGNVIAATCGILFPPYLLKFLDFMFQDQALTNDRHTVSQVLPSNLISLSPLLSDLTFFINQLFPHLSSSSFPSFFHVSILRHDVTIYTYIWNSPASASWDYRNVPPHPDL